MNSSQAPPREGLEHAPSSGDSGARSKVVLAGAMALLAVIVTLLHAGNLEGPFLFDDIPGILENPNIESLSPLARALDAPEGNGADRRPLVALSLAVNYALGERNVFGYHVFNLAVHVLASLTLLALVRRTVLSLDDRGPGRGHDLDHGKGHATTLGLLCALLWAVHPLHTSALHMVINRNELMAGLFAFATLFASASAFVSKRPVGWVLLAVLASFAGAASKEVVAGVPLLVWLYDRTVHGRTLWSSVQRHRFLYGGLALTWPFLAFLTTTGSRGDSAGFGLEGFGSLDYLFLQTGALLHYLKLSFWPKVLAFDYQDWPLPAGLADCWNEGLAVLALLSLSVWGLVRKRLAGWLGFAAFVLLAPSSSFIPLAGARLAEHRMYAPSAAVLALAILLLARCLRPLQPRVRHASLGLALVAAASVLAMRTRTRNEEFLSRRVLWGSTVAVRPNNARAWNSYGMALAAEGLDKAARDAYEQTLALEPTHYRALINLGNLYLGEANWAQARALYERALARKPLESDPHYYLGVIAVSEGDSRSAVQHLNEAISGELSAPLLNPALQSLAWVLATATDDSVRDGTTALRIATELDTRTGGRNPRVLDALAAALAETQDFDRAAQVAARGAELAASRGQAELSRTLQGRAQTYAQRRPWRVGR